jgi:large subunit ribosomal protein L16
MHATRSQTPATRGITVAFGSHGLKAMTGKRMSSNQIESARKVITRALGKNGKMWTRIFPDMPRTAKAAEVGMGSGKGDLKDYVFEVHPGHILFEIDGVPAVAAKTALLKAGKKLPVLVRVVERT